jgi:hypothetical protein
VDRGTVSVHGGLMRRQPRGSPELGRAGAVVRGSLPWWHGEQEKDEGVLTSGGGVTKLGRRR